MANNGFEEWYRNMPIITRSYMTGCFLTTGAVFLDVVSPLSLYLNFPLIFKDLQIWRLVTTFFFFDYFGINFLFHMFFLVRHSKLLEEGSFRGRTADYLFLHIFGGVLLLILSYLLYLAPPNIPKAMFLAPSLAFMIVYVWSRRNPHIMLSFLGLFNFRAPFLPYVILGFGMLLGHSPTSDILGIVIGHIYYFFEDVYPETSGRRLLRTPGILKAMFDVPVVPVASRPGGRPWGEGVQLNQQQQDAQANQNNRDGNMDMGPAF